VGAEEKVTSKRIHKSVASKTKQINNMKIMIPTYKARMIILYSLTVILGLLASPSSSMADREYIYRNCAELQKVMNDHNPELTLKGFEKVKMMKRITGYEKYMVFCNGGIVVDKEVGTICRGYIGYSFSRIGGGADYYARWGETNGSPNFNDTDAEKYCRLIK
jgi:hypothetical protein